MKIAFVYAGGRECRWNAALAGELPSDFFYGAVDLAKAGHEIVCIDAPENPRGILARLYNRLFGWRTPVRTRGEHIVAIGAVFDRLKNADVVVATTTSLAIALTFWKRIGRAKFAIVGIHCGLVNHPVSGVRLRSTRRALLAQEIVLFAESERKETIVRFGLEASRVHANPFGVDTDFWTPAETGTTGGGVLSVGNDGRRDYATLLRAVDGLDFPVQIVTSRALPAPLPANVTHIRGSWHRPVLSDAGLRAKYREAAVVVVPLEDAIQPSGQSVALQAMACGRPVILTRTAGLWTGDDFLDREHLVLVPASDPAALRREIEMTSRDAAWRERMGGAAREAVRERGTMKAFAARLESVLATAQASVSRFRR